MRPLTLTRLIPPAAAGAAIVVACGCFTPGGGGGGGTDSPWTRDGGAPGGGSPDPEQTLNVMVLGDTMQLEDPEQDTSVTTGGSGGARVELWPGSTARVALSYDAPAGNVIGMGMRFGDSGPIHYMPIPDAEGVTSGMMWTEFTVPPSICDMLSAVCHDIKCYEFAVVEGFKVTRANITDIALACNDCDEPSCQDLLSMCMGGTCDTSTTAGSDAPETHTFELGATSGTFTFSYETYSQEDQMTVLYEGSVLFDSGCVGTMGIRDQSITYSGSSTSVTVQVQPNCAGPDAGTSWEFTVGCPM